MAHGILKGLKRRRPHLVRLGAYPEAEAKRRAFSSQRAFLSEVDSVHAATRGYALE
jgi:hypothetical protein